MPSACNRINNDQGFIVIQGPQHDQVLTSLGRYDVLAVLGRGGMGVVYHAYDPILDRHVALKQLAPVLRQTDVVRHLRHEAISAARLRHPNIALLYEFGAAGDLPFLAMEYVSGVQLRALLERGRLPITRALHILEQIADALDYAHRMGVVHCDIKPSNILVDDADHAVLIDFGLAEIIADSPDTADTTLLGTPHYMSPEQAAGRSADGRSDQYALAAVAYELLTGVPPFHRRSAAAVVHAHLYEALPPATERCPSLPEAVNAPLLRALAKAPDARFPSAAAFVAALRLACAASAP